MHAQKHLIMSGTYKMLKKKLKYKISSVPLQPFISKITANFLKQTQLHKYEESITKQSLSDLLNC